MSWLSHARLAGAEQSVARGARLQRRGSLRQPAARAAGEARGAQCHAGGRALHQGPQLAFELHGE
jgi:hypothetical protein